MLRRLKLPFFTGLFTTLTILSLLYIFLVGKLMGSGGYWLLLAFAVGFLFSFFSHKPIAFSKSSLQVAPEISSEKNKNNWRWVWMSGIVIVPALMMVLYFFIIYASNGFKLSSGGSYELLAFIFAGFWILASLPIVLIAHFLSKKLSARPSLTTDSQIKIPLGGGVGKKLWILFFFCLLFSAMAAYDFYVENYFVESPYYYMQSGASKEESLNDAGGPRVIIAELEKKQLSCKRFLHPYLKSNCNSRFYSSIVEMKGVSCLPEDIESDHSVAYICAEKDRF